MLSIVKAYLAGPMVHMTLSFVMHDQIKRLFRVCDLDWKVAVCFCRCGGQRFPSDVFNRSWSEVNWEREVIVIDAQKTENSVLIPLNRTFYKYLSELFEFADEGSEFIFRDSPRNYSRSESTPEANMLKQLIKRSGQQA